MSFFPPNTSNLRPGERSVAGWSAEARHQRVLRWWIPSLIADGWIPLFGCLNPKLFGKKSPFLVAALPVLQGISIRFMVTVNQDLFSCLSMLKLFKSRYFLLAKSIFFNDKIIIFSSHFIRWNAAVLSGRHLWAGDRTAWSIDRQARPRWGVTSPLKNGAVEGVFPGKFEIQPSRFLRTALMNDGFNLIWPSKLRCDQDLKVPALHLSWSQIPYWICLRQILRETMLSSLEIHWFPVRFSTQFFFNGWCLAHLWLSDLYLVPTVKIAA